MELKQIKIQNFLSYFTETVFDFAPTTTIILGQNNTGKSKLFDAINWTIYERVYDTLKELWIYDIHEISELILNKRARLEGEKENQAILSTRTELSIDDGAERIKICREYSYNFINKNYSFANSNLSITVQDFISGKPYFYEGQDASSFLSQKFSRHISDFFLFQGEAGSRILKLQKGNLFRTAVRQIARLGIFEESVEFARRFEESAKLKITKQMNKNKKEKEEIDSLELDISKLEDEIQNLQDEKEELLEIRNKCQEEFDLISEKVESMKEFESYLRDKKQLEENRKRIEQQAKDADSIKATISEDAVFYKVLKKISSFKSFYQNLADEGKVPPSIPIYEIKKALTSPKKSCPICNGDLSENSEGRKFAESCLPNYDADRLGKYLTTLNSAMGYYEEEISKIPEILRNKLEEKSRIEKLKSSYTQNLKQLDEQLEQINITNQCNEEKKQELELAKSTYRTKEALLENAKTNLYKIVGKLEDKQKEFDLKKKELNSKIRATDDDVDDSDKVALTYAEKIHDAMKRLNQVVQTTTYKEIESRANEYYHEMTEENASLVGSVKIDINNSDIYTVDENGNKIQNINQANRISIQIAVIAGILTIASEQFEIQYPFVTDAPVSALGGDNKTPTIKTIIKAFDQAIIILKDDANTFSDGEDEIRRLIKENADVEVAYELKIQKASTINEQYTIIRKIK